MRIEQMLGLGFALVIIGVLIIIASLVIGAMSSKSNGDTSVKGGAVIMIGPIPLVIGSDKESTIFVMILAVILMVVAYFMTKGG